ncbi:MAG: hypothetical protein QXQ91_03990 [Nanopusillaceae archaeon]
MVGYNFESLPLLSGEEVKKSEATRKHFVEYKGNVVEIPLNIVKKSRFLSKLRGLQGLNSVD